MRLMYYSGSSYRVAINESKRKEKKAKVITELQRQQHPNLPFPLGICVKENHIYVNTILW